MQSAYCRHHSTVTIVSCVFSDIIMAANNGNMTGLSLLVFSAAFDTVSRAILLQYLFVSHQIASHALNWFGSYLSDRTQCIRYRGFTGPSTSVQCGLPHGYVLSSVLFILHTSDISSLASKFGLFIQCYTNDTQLYFHIASNHTVAAHDHLEEGIVAIYQWLSRNCLNMNLNKMEIL